ncbi:MAG TPA: nucleotidyltransferase domain-containing protein [Cyclobacteriaceae bacterium]|nr:nucleotidyltransferase domain-containing protein [Cyclobacteriaceae bacterium]
MNAVRQASYLMEEEKHLLRALLYFDIFDYPLTAEEIVQFSSATLFASRQALERLTAQGIIFRFQDFYSLQNNPGLVTRRLNGNALAEQKMKTAKKFSKLVSLFPFVRAVMLSGSISKGYMDEKSDIDYFIITEANRLWMVRTSLAVFRRIFLFNSHRNLCTNYFIDSQHLEIGEKNIFTAIELGTTKPMFGGSAIEQFQNANAWTQVYLPNLNLNTDKAAEPRLPLKRAIEKMFSFKMIDRVNRWLMNKTISHWRRRYGRGMDNADFEIAFRSTTGVSKSHPQFYQKKVLSRFAEKIRNFQTQNGIDLSL